MLTGVDKKTGQGLDDVNIRYQILTFLIAGHETTSGLLSFAVYFLLKNPDSLAKAYEEVDRVLGPRGEAAPTHTQVHQLVYVQQVLKESLRLWPTAPAIALYPREDTTLGGRFALSKGEYIIVFLPMLHRDQTVWGQEVEDFRPDRFAPELERLRAAQRVQAVWKRPEGLHRSAVRDARGDARAWYDPPTVRADRPCQLPASRQGNAHTQTRGLHDEGPAAGAPRAYSGPGSPVAVSIAQETAEAAAPPPSGRGTPLLVLFGSNMGTAEGIAQRIAEHGRALGFSIAVAPLDEYVGNLPREGVVIIVTASYNGAPPDNAVRFCDWLQKGIRRSSVAPGVRYAVFGCGDHNWAENFQAIPKLIDETLAARGATRIHRRGAGDAADDFAGQFRAWHGPLWGRIASALGLEIKAAHGAISKAAYRIEAVKTQVEIPIVAAYSVCRMTVVANRELQAGRGDVGPERSTRHIELAPARNGRLPRRRPSRCSPAKSPKRCSTRARSFWSRW